MSVPSLKLRPPDGLPKVIIREVVIWILAVFSLGIYLIGPIKEMFSSFSQFYQTLFPKPPTSPPLNLYQKKPSSSENWKHKEVFVNGVNYHFVEDGNPSDQTILFIHGFPEFWYSWRHQMVEFSKSYRVVAVDLKGYADTDKPLSLSAYTPESLVEDLAQFIVEIQKTSTASNKKVILVGHDWGGILTWFLGISYQNLLIDRLIVMNCPHPLGFSKNANFTQMISSLYMFFFCLPYIPELFLRRKNYDVVRVSFRSKKLGLVHQDRFTAEDEQMFVWALSRPGTLTAILNYYRNLVRGVRIDLSPKITIPTLVIWGEKDSVLQTRLLNGLDRWVVNSQINYIEDASHWVQQDTPEKVNRIISYWLNNEKKKEN